MPALPATAARAAAVLARNVAPGTCVVVTLGDQGALAVRADAPEGGKGGAGARASSGRGGGGGAAGGGGRMVQQWRQPAFPPEPGRAVVDVTGAGDAFAAGFVHEFHRARRRAREHGAAGAPAPTPEQRAILALSGAAQHHNDGAIGAALAFGCAAAAVTVGHQGAVCSPAGGGAMGDARVRALLARDLGAASPPPQRRDSGWLGGTLEVAGDGDGASDDDEAAGDAALDFLAGDDDDASDDRGAPGEGEEDELTNDLTMI